MKIQINKKVVEIPNESVLNLSQILKEVSSIIPADEIIQSVIVNKKQLEPNWIQNAETIYLLDEDIIEVSTSPANNIAKSTLKNAQNYLIQIIATFKQCAEDYRMFEDEKANKKYAVNIDNLQLFFKILEDANRLCGKSLESIANEKINFGELIPQFHNIFDEMFAAQQNKDWIQLADVIEYELVERLNLIDKNYKVFLIDKLIVN